MSVVPEKAAATLEFEGKKYFFCAKSCAAKFEKEPKRYLSGNIPAGMPATEDRDAGFVSIGGLSSEGQLQRPSRKMAPTTEESIASVVSTIRYTCPMHPEVVKMGPGSCPKCGMALEPMDVVAETGPDPEYISMRMRFWVSAALSLPVLLLGMFGEKLHFGISAAAMRWIGLGTGAAYLESVVATIFPGWFPGSLQEMGAPPVYFEAAAVITTLVLLGQVLELKARSKT